VCCSFSTSRRTASICSRSPITPNRSPAANTVCDLGLASSFWSRTRATTEAPLRAQVGLRQRLADQRAAGADRQPDDLDAFEAAQQGVQRAVFLHARNGVIVAVAAHGLGVFVYLRQRKVKAQEQVLHQLQPALQLRMHHVVRPQLGQVAHAVLGGGAGDDAQVRVGVARGGDDHHGRAPVWHGCHQRARVLQMGVRQNAGVAGIAIEGGDVAPVEPLQAIGVRLDHEDRDGQ
jgi:hypothetical protein